MLKVIFFILINTANTLAYNISIEGEGELQNCTANSSEQMFYCKNNKGEEFLIKEKHWEFVGLKRDSSGKYHSADIYNISDESGNDIFLANYNSREYFSQNEKQRYQGPLNDYINNERYIYSTFFNDPKNDKSIGQNEIEKFYKKAKSEIENKKEKIENSLNASNYKIKLSDGQEIKCSKSATKGCPLVNCEKDSEGYNRIIIKPQSSFYMYMESFAFKKNRFSVPKNSMVALYQENGEKLIEYKKQNDGPFTSDMLVPEKFKSNPELFNNLIKPSYSSFLSSHLKECDKKILENLMDITNKTKEDLENASMLQYIDLVNGIMESNYINEKSIPGNSCYYNGAYYGPTAYQKALEVEVMSKKTISIERAQELFDQAFDRKDIAWDYTFDGCYARAHIMAKMFEDEGVHVDKAWLRGTLKIPGQPEGMNWGYHVAPVVYVEDTKGKVQEMIIDPSVSKTPITPKQWAKIMKVEFDDTEQVSFPTPENTAFYNKTSYSVTNSTPYWPVYNDRLSEEDKINMATRTMLEYGGEPSGNTEWEQWAY